MFPMKSVLLHVGNFVAHYFEGIIPYGFVRSRGQSLVTLNLTAKPLCNQ